MSADGLVTWLREQLNEDERRHASIHDIDSDCELVATAGYNGPCTCGWANHVLHEVEAKRRILDEYEDAVGATYTGNETPAWVILEPIVRLFALPYADRDGYREEWRP